MNERLIKIIEKVKEKLLKGKFLGRCIPRNEGDLKLIEEQTVFLRV